jgi:hypothetical protein
MLPLSAFPKTPSILVCDYGLQTITLASYIQKVPTKIDIAMLRPFDPIQNQDRIRSSACKGVHNQVFTKTDLTSFKTRSAVPIANRSATSKRSLSEI